MVEEKKEKKEKRERWRNENYGTCKGEVPPPLPDREEAFRKAAKNMV